MRMYKATDWETRKSGINETRILQEFLTVQNQITYLEKQPLEITS